MVVLNSLIGLVANVAPWLIASFWMSVVLLNA